MNTKGNQRYAETKQKIKGTFLNLLKEKTADKITVTEICKAAQIHRTTFYGHYEDVSALVNEMVGEMYEQIIDFFVKSDWKNGENGFEKLFFLIREQKEFFRQYLNGFGLYPGQRNRLPELLMKNMGKMIDVMGFEDEEELYYHQTFFCNGLIAVIERWIAGDCKESPQKMCQILEKEYQTNPRFFQWKK